MFYYTNFRDQDGSGSIYEPVAVISHHGQMTIDGEGQGHYTCDVKSIDGHWYKTNDNTIPIFYELLIYIQNLMNNMTNLGMI